MNKKIAARFLCLLLSITLLCSIPAIAAPVEATPAPERFKVTLDGELIPVAAYGIEGSTYLKLTDISSALGVYAWWDADNFTARLETDKELESKTSFTPESPAAEKIEATPAPDNFKVTLDGTLIPVTAYGISGSTYLKLTDISSALGINAWWDNDNFTARLETGTETTPVETPEVTPEPTSEPVPEPTAKPAASFDPNKRPAALPSAYEHYEGIFSVGVAVSSSQITGNAAEVVKQHFNSITCENDMKPSNLLNMGANRSDPAKYNTEPAVSFTKAEPFLKFAKDNGLKMRGHVLVWHSQTPRGFFTENYQDNGKLVSKDIMLKRMESYIQQVLEYCQTNYPGVIYAWDVVNEAIDDGGGARTDSRWYEVFGDLSFVEKAFEYARKYADQDVKLFYNDYNSFMGNKLTAIYNLIKPIYEKGTLDGMGMQGHVLIDWPNAKEFQDAVLKYAGIGKDMEIQVTELDIDNSNDGSEAGAKKLAQRYKELMDVLRTLDAEGKAKVTNVTVWGLTDSQSWKKNTSKYPLLFDGSVKAKEALWGFLGYN